MLQTNRQEYTHSSTLAPYVPLSSSAFDTVTITRHSKKASLTSHLLQIVCCGGTHTRAEGIVYVLSPMPIVTPFTVKAFRLCFEICQKSISSRNGVVLPTITQRRCPSHYHARQSVLQIFLSCLRCTFDDNAYIRALANLFRGDGVAMPSTAFFASVLYLHRSTPTGPCIHIMSSDLSGKTFSVMALTATTKPADTVTLVSSAAPSIAFTAEGAFRFGAFDKSYKMQENFTINKVMYMIHWGWSIGYGYLPGSVDTNQILKKGALNFWAVVTPLRSGESTTKSLTMECRACYGRSYFYYGTGEGPTRDPKDWFNFRREQPKTTGGVVDTFEGETGNHMKSLMSGFIKRGEPVGSESVPDYWEEHRVQEVIVHAVNDAIEALCP
jgi:hypothetical protein